MLTVSQGSSRQQYLQLQNEHKSGTFPTRVIPVGCCRFLRNVPVKMLWECIVYLLNKLSSWSVGCLVFSLAIVDRMMRTVRTMCQIWRRKQCQCLSHLRVEMWQMMSQMLSWTMKVLCNPTTRPHKRQPSPWLACRYHWLKNVTGDHK